MRFLAPARHDLADATVYYEEQMPGLGAQFLDEVRAAIDRIRAFPLAWQPLLEQGQACVIALRRNGAGEEEKGEKGVKS